MNIAILQKSVSIDGSLRCLFRISFPLMLSFFSMNVMLFVDRLLLARYSTEAFHDVLYAGNLYWSLSFPFIILIDIAEVFVARLNGAKNYNQLAQPVWQMLWLILPISILFFLLGKWGSEWLFQAKYFETLAEKAYFKWHCYFMPGTILFSAICTFYSGRGKTKIITACVLLGNGLNIVLDYALIFGVRGMIPSLGLDGSIIASGISIFSQAVIFFILFLNKNNRTCFGTANWNLHVPILIKAIKLGFPASILICFELLGWTTFLWMMKKISDSHVLIVGICQSIMQLFFCFGTGLEQASIAITGNLIGSKQVSQISRVLKSGLILISIEIFLISLVLIVSPNLFIDLFAKQMGNEIKATLKLALIFLTLYLAFENIRWLVKGMLIATGDTVFIMASGLLCTWVFLVLPVYFFVYIPQAPVLRAFCIWVIYSLMLAGISLLRFFQKNATYQSIQ